MTRSQKRWLALARECLVRSGQSDVDDVLKGEFDLEVSEKLKNWAFEKLSALEDHISISET